MYNKHITGLCKQGFVKNMPGQLSYFNTLLAGSGKIYSFAEQAQVVDNATVTFWNSRGAASFNNQELEDQYRVYKVLYTGCMTADGQEVLGLFTRNWKTGKYVGVDWGTAASLQATIGHRSSHYWLGELAFENQQHLNSFLREIADMASPEPWDTDPQSKTGGFDFLRSYVEHMFARLREEEKTGAAEKIVYSADRSHIIWNTNLADRFGHDIILSAEVRCGAAGKEYFCHHGIITKGVRELRALGFSGREKPQAASFFKDANDIIFHPEWRVDTETNFLKLKHAVEDNRERFPKNFQNMDSEYVARSLTNAIAMSSGIAKRDFRFIVPMYSSTHGSLQFLMPLYLGGKIKKTPDLAVILTADDGYYIPETVIGMKEAYMDARLISKPDEAWLK